MSATATADPRVVHSLPGRVRVHVPAWSGENPEAVEHRLRALPGVRAARASSYTRNVLVEFDPQSLDAADIARRLGRIVSAAAAAPTRAASQARRRAGSLLRSSARRARIAVRGLDRDPALGRRLVVLLERRPDVKRVTPSPLTGRVLVELAHEVRDLQPILDAIADIEPAETERDHAVPEHPLDPAPIIDAGAKLIGAALGLGLLLARRARGAVLPPIQRAGLGDVAAALNLLETVPALAKRVEHALGHERKDIAFAALGIVSMTSSGSVLGLTFSGAVALRQLTEARVRRATWHEYERRVGDLPAAYPGAVITVAPGQRVPLSATVLDGTGVCPTPDAEPLGVRPGAQVDAGARVYGGPLTVRLHADGSFTPRAERPPPPRSLHDRYREMVPYAALAYAAATAVRARSLARALTGLLLVNPRAALAARENANRAAAARVMRAGVTVPASRADRVISRPDVLLIDGLRTIYPGWEPRAADGVGAYTADHALAIAGAVSAAAGSPWGLTLGSGRRIGSDGSFDGNGASAEVDGERWRLEPAEGRVPGALEPAPGELLLLVRRQDDGTLTGWLLLQPRLSRGWPALVRAAHAEGVELEVVARTDTRATRRLARRADVTLSTGDAAARVDALQREGKRVTVVGDSVNSAAAFDAADLAVALTSGLSGSFLARADLLAPRLEAIAAILECGARRDLAVRDGTLLSVGANVAGATWGMRSAPRFRLGGYPAMAAGLAAMLDGSVRLSGGRRARSVTERLSDPLPERWGRERVDDVIRHLRTSRDGLSNEEAARRARPRLEQLEQPGLLDLVLEQVRSPIVTVLGVGAALSVALGALGDVVMIVAVVAANAAVGAWQERQAGTAVEALREMTGATARALRDGREMTLSADELVPGDVILLASGPRVPADAPLLDATALEVDEAALTGESIPTPKMPDGPTDASRILLEGTDVTTGTGRAVVVAVGAETRMGAIAAALAENGGERRSPLDERLGRILWKGLPLIAAGGAIVTAAGLAWRRPLLSQLALGASVAIAAVPEGLPLLAGVAEAAVARRLAHRHALVTRLSAVEALGRVDVACADKTGTLTSGKLAVTVVADAFGAGAAPSELTPALREVVRAGALASTSPDAADAHAHPTDVAVVEGARAAGVGGGLGEREAEARFDPTRAYHATIAGGRLHAKGAAEVLAERCTRVRTADGDVPLEPAGRAELLARAEAVSAEGLRVLLVAEGPGTADPEEPENLIALGFIGISDPLRPTVPAAIDRCHDAGVRVIMLTGDHPATARAIARQAGLPHSDDRVLTGLEVASLDDDALRDRLEHATIIARSTPLDKLRIIDALQQSGHVVAMTGDGVNDAPALRLADVGVAMGRGGTEVARQAADLVVTDDDFSTLAEALVEGRAFWHNMRRSLGLLLGGNAGEVGLMTAASVAGLSAPLTTRQVLTVNLVTDVLPAVSVAIQPPEHRNLAELSREHGAALDAPLRADIVRRAIATAVPSTAAYVAAAMLGTGEQARTVAYISIVTTQLAQTIDLGRSEGQLTPGVLAAVAVSLAAVGATVAVPGLRSFFALVAPSPTTLVLAGAASGAAVLVGRALPEGWTPAPAPAS
jgi:cation-transporting ATPase I